MSNWVHCQNCGGRVEIPPNYSRAKIRCGGCGYYAEIPPEMRSAAEEPTIPTEESPALSAPRAEPRVARAAPAKPTIAPKAKPQIDPRDHRPRFEPDEPGGKPLLDGTQDEDDDRPYAVPGTGTKNCPKCRSELPLNAVFCVHCGRDLQTGEKVKKRTFEPIDREWEEGWSLQFRLQLLIGCVALDFLALIVLIINGDYSVGVITLLLQLGLQAFLLGTFDRLNVKRTSKGEATLTRTQRLAFLTMKVTKVKWKKSEGLGLVGSHNPGIFAWLICIYCAMLCIVPAIAFYWFIIRPERFEVILCDTYGGTDEIIFRSKDRDHAHEVGRIVAEATGLWYRAVL